MNADSTSAKTDSLPLVSMIIRSIGRATLAAALDTAAGQDWPNLEIVVVAASGASHADLPGLHGNRPLRLVRSDVQLGRSAAANAGLEAAQGELLAFLDDDDVLLPQHVSALAVQLLARPDLVAAYSAARAQNQNGEVVRLFGRPFDRIGLYLENYLPIHTVLFRRRVLASGVRFDTAFDLCEDWDFWIQVAQCGEFVFHDSETAVYCIAEGSGYGVQGDPQAAYLAERAVFAKWLQRFDENIQYALLERGRLFRAEQEKNKKLIDENNLLKIYNDDLRQTIATLSDEFSRQTEQYGQAQAARDYWQQQYQDVLASHSWRLTAPLRRLGRLARLLRRAGRGWLRLDGKTRLRVVFWLLSGRIAPARRCLALASQTQPPAQHAAAPLCAAPALWPQAPPAPLALLRTVDIVLPVYNGMEYLPALFDSLARADSTPYRLLVCDDASPEAAVWPFLQQQAQRFGELASGCVEFLLLQNAHNLGFVGTVNRLFEHTQDDFVLLNSDTQVPRYWLERLLAPLDADDKIASVTPFTNAGAICSFPRFFEDNALPADMDVDAVDACFARLRDYPPPQLPSAVGFCMAIRHRLAKEIGMFDPAFGKGYREENDWCERARAAGFEHVLAANLFVEHKHGGSFPDDLRENQLEKNAVLLQRRYPGVFDFYRAWIERDPLAALRQFMEVIVLAAASKQAVFVTLENTIAGGAEDYCERRLAQKKAENKPVLRLIDDFRSRQLRAHWQFGEQQRELHFADYEQWSHLLDGVEVEELLVNNLYSFRSPVNCMRWLAALPERCGIRPTIAGHDFFMVCPSLFLIDAERKFCDVPDAGQCRQCYGQMHLDFEIGVDDVADWRQHWQGVLAAAACIEVFSNSTADLLARVYPDCKHKITVKPHSMTHFEPQQIEVDLHAPLVIGVVGSISWHKGWQVVRALCDEIDARQLDVRIHVIGAMVPEYSAACLTCTGRYQPQDLVTRMHASGANLFFFPSIWPETFSYVAHEIMACGVPFCCFDLGAPAEAARAYDKGCLLPLDGSAEQWLQMMEDFRQRLLAGEGW